MKQMIKEYWFWTIIAMTFCLIIATIGIYNQKTQIKRLKEQNEFESIRQGICVYVEYGNNWIANYILVYDEETEKVIEVDIVDDEMVHRKIEAGDTIVYVVDYNYTDADFLNVIKQN